VDYIRDEVTSFCSTLSFTDSKIKIIILDEFDGISMNAQKNLRGVMEQFANNCRFILTCNFENVIIDAIHSRCQQFNFGTGDAKDVARRCVDILKKEGIDCSDTKHDIVKLIKKHGKDIRKIINDMQKCCTNGKFSFSEETLSKDQKDELITLLKAKNIKGIRADLLGTGADYPAFYSTLFDRSGEIVKNNERASAMIIVGEYMNQHSTTINPEINFVTCLLQLCKIM
jgi:DNA polymerase III delta prime subunit